MAYFLLEFFRPGASANDIRCSLPYLAPWSRNNYAGALFADPAATLDDLREAVTTLEETERIARRVFGGAHPATTTQDRALRDARAALRARET